MFRFAALWMAFLVVMEPHLAAAAPELPRDPPLEVLAPLSDESRLRLGPFEDGVPSPAKVLGYELGHRFTPQARMLDYLEILAGASRRVRLWEYGRTYEDRPLVLLAISSEGNLRRLEDLRQRQLVLANDGGLSRAEIEELVASQPAVVWLAYGIHGNESSSTEAAMATAYALAAATGDWQDLLNDVVVLIDPLVNPDGRERYVQGFVQRRGYRPDASRNALEHEEPWPGGRFNHYLMDLNRDWTWATQVETQARLAAYRRWEPQVYADFHEMGSESSYFFPPAAEPILPAIDPRTLSWLERFGRANGSAFDRQGWLYYKAQNFDLFYPGYGDSYPALRGAVGMTYEVGGGGLGGLVLRRKSGDSRTLSDRIGRHFTTGMTTVRVAAEQRQALLGDFAAVRRRAFAENPRTFLWSSRSPEGDSLAALLRLHGIEVGALARRARLKVAAGGGEAEERDFSAGTYVVNSAQPLGGLAATLLDRDAEMPAEFIRTQRQRLERNLSPQFFDITSWSLPLAFGVETWTLAGTVPGATATSGPRQPDAGLRGEGSLGFLVPPQGLAGIQLAARLQADGFGYRIALEGLQAAGVPFPPGTIFVPALGNDPQLGIHLESLSHEMGLEIHRLASGYLAGKVSPGSDELVAIRPPRIGLLGGSGVSPTDHGALWFLLDRLVEVPYSRLDLGRLGDSRLDEFDVLLLPDGSGFGNVRERVAESLVEWVHEGGFLIAVGRAIPWLSDLGLSDFREWRPEGLEEGVARLPLAGPLSTPGAALAGVPSAGHALAVYSSGPTPVLARGERILLPTGDPRRDLLTVREEDPVLSGFAWPEATERLRGSVLAGLEPQEKGRVMVFAHNPAFRLFWRATMPTLLHALLHGPSLAEAGFLD